ncbi:MAG TPA: response regulator [bacterium]|nr:response regulator [bacterium]
MSEKARVLIIDDDEDFRISIRTLLQSEGYQTIEADSGKQGLEKIKLEKPDVILLDIMMETMDEGYLLNQVLKFQKQYEDFKAIPILMVSSIQEDPLSRFPKAAGQVDMIIPDYYFSKPVDIPKFLETLKKVLQK